MKKVLLIVALILFAGGLYVNFMMEPSGDQADINNDTETSDEIAENSTDEQEENGTVEEDGENPESGEESDDSVESEPEPEAEMAFNQENLNDVYNEAVENNESLIIDVLLPEYYTEGFVDALAEEFDTETIQFNFIGLDANTSNLSELNVNENSDAVIIDALQIQDYNDEVFFERDIEALTSAYMNVYNNGKTVFLLGNANVYADENFTEVLAEEESNFTENDYYYIDNQNVEDDFDNNGLTAETENEIIGNIYDYLISE